MKSNAIYRSKILFSLVVLFAFILISRLYFVQIVLGEEFSKKANNQYFRTNYHLFDRGLISFKTKDGDIVPAAGQSSGFLVFINPQVISNPDEVYKKINSIVPLDYDSFIEKSQRKTSTYQEILKRVDLDSADKIRELNLSGVGTHQERWRHYPGESMASHVLGLMAYKEDEFAGRYGLERYYENTLSRGNQEVFVNFFAEVFLNIKDSISNSSKRAGDIVTTIEPNLQAFVEKELEYLNQRWSSENSGIIVVDPKTGEILSMAVYPKFNPNSFRNEESSKIFSNPLVENVYEMGSIIKPLTVASGLDSGSITAYTTYFDEGSIFLNGRRISNYDGEARGLTDMQGALNNSLNTGMAFIVSQMGNKKFSEYMLNFGIGEATGVDLPNEAVGLVGNLKSTRDLEYATASFGQGIAMTPIAAVRALSALANGGTLITPHVVSRVEYKSGLPKNVSHGKGERVISEETSEEISRMLVNVVDEALLGGSLKIPNYSVAAKTGTAQIPDESGGYSEDKFLHSFFGYFPAYDPEFLVFLMTYDPKGVEYASQTLSHSFMDIVKYIINYYDIPPDR